MICSFIKILEENVIKIQKYLDLNLQWLNRNIQNHVQYDHVKQMIPHSLISQFIQEDMSAFYFTPS